MSDDQTSVDATQDEQIEMTQETVEKMLRWFEAQGGQMPDLRPESWKEAEPGPIPYTDQAICHPYLFAGHLVKRSGGRYVDACCPAPEAPFNPYWGLDGHPNELIGIMKFSKKSHTEFIKPWGGFTAAQRLQRIAEVIKRNTTEQH